MTDGIKETIPKVLRTLWDLENELRRAALSGAVLNRREAREHLAGARQHLDALRELTRKERTASGPTEVVPDQRPGDNVDH